VLPGTNIPHGGAAVNTLSLSAPSLSAIAGALTGVILWALQEYVFKTGVPEAVEGAVLVIIPALLSWLASLLTKRSATAAPAAEPKHAAHP
jgi:hypothetical protein